MDHRPAKAIAARAGYGTPTNFIRAFRRMFGMTPGRFREVGTVPLG